MLSTIKTLTLIIYVLSTIIVYFIIAYKLFLDEICNGRTDISEADKERFLKNEFELRYAIRRLTDYIGSTATTYYRALQDINKILSEQMTYEGKKKLLDKLINAYKQGKKLERELLLDLEINKKRSSIK